jgi:hypothetical protein
MNPEAATDSSVHPVIRTLIKLTGINRTTVTSSLTAVLVNLGCESLGSNLYASRSILLMKTKTEYRKSKKL